MGVAVALFVYLWGGNFTGKQVRSFEDSLGDMRQRKRQWCVFPGVQVGNFEYCFGEGAGIICSPINPRISGEHNFSDGTYEYSIFMGKCHFDSQELQSTIRSFEHQYPGSSYDLVKRNCNHFSDNFLKVLIGRGIPSYINRASRYGRWLRYGTPSFRPAGGRHKIFPSAKLQFGLTWCQLFH